MEPAKVLGWRYDSETRMLDRLILDVKYQAARETQIHVQPQWCQAHYRPCGGRVLLAHHQQGCG